MFSTNQAQQSSALKTRWEKVQLSDGVRMMMNNQRALDSTNKRLQNAIQSEQAGLQAANPTEYRELLKQGSPQSQSASPNGQGQDDGMNFSLDSPVTTNHYYPNQQPAQGMSTIAKLGIAALAATGIGAPAAIGLTQLPAIIQALKSAPAVPQTAGSLLQDFDLLVGPPPAPAPPKQ